VTFSVKVIVCGLFFTRCHDGLEAGHADAVAVELTGATFVSILLELFWHSLITT
jgi:hypothetical protein